MIRSGLTNVQKAGYGGYPHERKANPRSAVERPFVALGDATVARKSSYSSPMEYKAITPSPVMYNDIFAKKTSPDERLYILRQIQQGLDKIQQGVLFKGGVQPTQVPLPSQPDPQDPQDPPAPDVPPAPPAPTDQVVPDGIMPGAPEDQPLTLEVEEEAQDVVAGAPQIVPRTEAERATNQWLHMQHLPQWRQIEGRQFNTNIEWGMDPMKGYSQTVPDSYKDAELSVHLPFHSYTEPDYKNEVYGSIEVLGDDLKRLVKKAKAGMDEYVANLGKQIDVNVIYEAPLDSSIEFYERNKEKFEFFFKFLDAVEKASPSERGVIWDLLTPREAYWMRVLLTVEGPLPNLLLDELDTHMSKLPRTNYHPTTQISEHLDINPSTVKKVINSNGVGPRKFRDSVIEPYRPRVVRRDVLKKTKKVKQKKATARELQNAYNRGGVAPESMNRMNLANAYARGGVKTN